LQGDKSAAQLAVNQMLLLAPPVAAVYYGYDEIADLLNVEVPAQQFKEAFVATAWNIADPVAWLHIRGESGLLFGLREDD
jgi:hypothetical protein